MNSQLIHGCRYCGTLFVTSIVLCPAALPDGYYCPTCGGLAEELGPAPQVTFDDGRYYLVDSHRSTGPYPTAHTAQLDLWSWFGGVHGNLPEEGRQEGDQEKDCEEVWEEEYDEEYDRNLGFWRKQGVIVSGGDA